MRRFIRFGHLRPILTISILAAGVVTIATRERSQAGLRQTRASLQEVSRALESYMAEHDGGCPTDIQEIAAHTKHNQVARDAWGQLPRLACPSPQSDLGYEVISDGPDRIPGGLDRVE